MIHRDRAPDGRSGTASIGLIAVTAGVALAGVAFFGYHRPSTGHAIKSVVPEWEVAAVDGEPEPACTPTPREVPAEQHCRVSARLVGARGGAYTVPVRCVLTSEARYTCEPIGIEPGEPGYFLAGVDEGRLTCLRPGATGVPEEAPAWTEPTAAGATAADFEARGVPPQDAAALAAAGRCSPLIYQGRMRDADTACAVDLACTAEAGCDDALTKLGAIGACARARAVRDQCFGSVTGRTADPPGMLEQVTTAFDGCLALIRGAGCATTGCAGGAPTPPTAGLDGVTGTPEVIGTTPIEPSTGSGAPGPRTSLLGGVVELGFLPPELPETVAEILATECRAELDRIAAGCGQAAGEVASRVAGEVLARVRAGKPADVAGAIEELLRELPGALDDDRCLGAAGRYGECLLRELWERIGPGGDA